MERVVVQKCEEYEKQLVTRKINKIFELLGGVDSFVQPGQSVLLKVNLLMGKSPEQAITTHPVLVKEIARILKEAGAEVIIGDSPGGLFTEKSLKKVYDRTGMTDISQELDIELNYNPGSKKHSFPAGKVKKSFVIGDFVTEADLVINLPKLKTHNMTMYTGAVKNLFGVIPGLLKGEYHLRTPDVKTFSEMLIDLALKVDPVLNIMDAVVGMEGEGPSGAGIPRKFGHIMASTSSLALDVAGAYLMGIEPLTDLPLLEMAATRNLPAKFEDIEVDGDILNQFKDVEIPGIEKESNLIDKRLPAPLSKLADYLLKPKPYFNEDDCVLCGKCVQNCPADVLEINSGAKPELEVSDCIRCFCCQELCEYDAVEVKRPFLGKLVFEKILNN